MKTHTLAIAAILIGLLGSTACLAQGTQAASTTGANSLAGPDKAFVQAASMSSSTEIDAAKLAEKQSKDKDVKSFARHMAADHTKLTVQLKMAAPHGVTVPKDNSDMAVLDSLKGLTGPEFDKTYIQQVALDGHKKAVVAFQTEADGGNDPALKKAAQKALPTIKEHLQMAQDLAKKKGVPSGQ
jgi:putative membrane protein